MLKFRVARHKSFLLATTARSKKLSGIDNGIVCLFNGFIFHNGAETYFNNKLLCKNYFTNDELLKVLHLLNLNENKISIITNNKYFANFDALKYWSDIDNLEIFNSVEDLSRVFAPKINIMIERERQIKIFKNIFNVNTDFTIEFTDNYKYCIIEKSSSNKGNAVKFIKNHLKDYFTTTIAIGNDSNDIFMFKECDYKVCVSNSSRDLIEIADTVIGSNNEEGVAKYLLTYLDGFDIHNIKENVYN